MPRLLVSDPEALVALERDHGLSLAALLHEHPDAVATSGYGAGPLAAIERALRKRVDADRAEDPRHTGVGMRHVHRQFEPAWLAADDTRFELIGVVNRMDREVFARATTGDGGPRSFGETRLIYRLAYTRTQKGTTVDSRLPMTVNVVFWQRPDDAASERPELQRRWAAPPGLAGAELASWLRAPGHALAPALLEASLLEAVEINVQTERWPSTIRPDMAGHAEYLLEVFHREGDRWVAAPLENTPDVKRLARDAETREALRAWLVAPDQRASLDAGTIVVPERFLATAATSVTPRGFARLANRPWSQLFTPDDFADYEFEGMQTVRSPRALLRRLDGLSCQGCHASRSIAGFHLLGAERDPDKAVDALAVFTSPHLEGELERRATWHAAVLAAEPPSEVRLLSEHERGRGRWGTRCGLGDPGFADWTCDPGLSCTALTDPELGTCLEPSPAGVGGVCELGTIKARADHHRDRVTKIETSPCAAGGVCNDNRVGFPDGMCAFACASAGPEGACGVIPNLRGFNDCLAADRPFAQCLVDTATPAGMRACSVDAPCRDDYICARSGSDAGVCLPPYFLFQLRVDGHPR
ncbi:hypothetical protein ENSA5_04230 [Enhygromyxa salina]|uniref:Uncharacterized protein n=1 Tax=Enhygromyxa salina TaxID=215803 RepID=A0A2S9YJA4_9BACT|nr:hypothetical protein ENSA5_04230 [Enhygromyxa salina]